MTLELTIQEMFEKFPTLFKERSDCLDHLFCAIGNGYEWQNGELIYIGRDNDVLDSKYLEGRLVNGMAHQHNKMSLRAESIYYFEKNNEDKDKYPKEARDKLDELAQKYFESLPDDVYHKRERKYRWSFYLQGYCLNYAYLWKYPLDIKPDWLSGIEECKSMLMEDGYDIEHPNENSIDRQANWRENIEAYKKREWTVK